jgi:hypothetical protein
MNKCTAHRSLTAALLIAFLMSYPEGVLAVPKPKLSPTYSPAKAPTFISLSHCLDAKNKADKTTWRGGEGVGDEQNSKLPKNSVIVFTTLEALTFTCQEYSEKIGEVAKSSWILLPKSFRLMQSTFVSRADKDGKVSYFPLQSWRERSIEYIASRNPGRSNSLIGIVHSSDCKAKHVMDLAQEYAQFQCVRSTQAPEKWTPDFGGFRSSPTDAGDLAFNQPILPALRSSSATIPLPLFDPSNTLRCYNPLVNGIQNEGCSEALAAFNAKPNAEQ